MTFGLSFLAVFAVCVGTAALPSVEGTGFRGVSLGWFATPATRIEVDFALSDPQPQMRVFGSDHEASGLCASLYVNSAGRFSFGVGDKFKAHPTEIVADTRRYVGVLDLAARKGTLLTGGQVVAEQAITAPCTRTAVMPLVAMARPLTRTGRTYGGCAKAKVFGVKVYEGGKLVRDFVPAEKKGVPGLCDRVTGLFAENGWRVPHWEPIVTAPQALTDERGHIQGMCVAKDALFLTMAGGISKMDWRGRLLRKIPQSAKKVHTGDVCWWKERLYAAICCFPQGPFFGKNEKTGQPLRGCLQVYDGELNLVKSRPIDRPPDGIVCIDGVLYVGLGSSFYDKRRPYRGTYFGKFDAETLEPLCEPFVVDNGYDAWAGVQNLATDGEFIYANFYVPDETAGTPNFIKYDRDFKVKGAWQFGYGQGFDFVPGGCEGTRRFLCCETVDWLDWSAPPSASGKQGYLHFAELKDGKFADISVRNGFRVQKERW